MPRNKIDAGCYDTPHYIVEAMLDFARLDFGERLMDLGHGDGRIPIEAAKRGGYGIGIERNLKRYEASVHNCQDLGFDQITELISGFSVADRKRPRIEPRIKLIYGRIEDYLKDNAALGSDCSLRGIQVVALYLTSDANRVIRPYLEDPKTGLPNDARVVSHDFAFRSWKARRVKVIKVPHGADHEIFLYRMKAVRESLGLL